MSEIAYPDWVKVGASFKMSFGKDGSHGSRIIHIRGFVDDRVVLREWLKHKQKWYYFVENQIWFDSYKKYITLR